MKKFFYDRRIISLYLFTIILLIIGVTYAINSNSLDLGLTTAVVRIDEQAYGQTEFDSSNLDFVPILDNEVEERKENVIDIDFRVGGASTNNNDHIIYDIVLKDLEVNCVLLSPYLKWKLVKNGEELATGSLDYHFDTIDEYGRLILTTIQEDLPRYSANQEGYDHYQFYLWLSDSCQSDDISACQNAPDQSEFMGQNLAGKIEVELYTEGKKEHVRKPSTTIGDSFCKDRYLVNFDPSGGSVSVPSKYVINGELFGELPIPTKQVTVTFETNGGGDISLISSTKDVSTSITQNKLFSVPKVKLLANEANQQKITYNFEGWYADKELTQKINDTDVVNVTENITLYVKWTGDNTITLPSTSKDGYDFLGWYQDPQLNHKIGNPGDSYEVNGDQTIYGKWQVNTYTVNYDGNKFSTTNQTINGLTISYDETTSYLTLNGTPTQSVPLMQLKNQTFEQGSSYKISMKYISGSYSSSSNGTLSVYANKTDNKWTSTPNWVDVSFINEGEITKNLIINSAAATEGSLLYSFIFIETPNTWTFNNYVIKVDISKVYTSNISYGSTYGTLPEDPTRNGYTFTGWYTEEIGGNQITSDSVMITSNNHTIYAHWTPTTYTLVANPTSGSIPATTGWTAVTSRSTYTKNINFGSAYETLPTPTRTGYTFTGWYNTTPSISFSMTAATNNYQFYRVLNDIYPGATYNISIGSVTLTSGTATKFATLLYDFTTQQTIASVQMSFGNNVTYSITCPSTADASHDIGLIMYSGINGSTSNNNTKFTNVVIATNGNTTSTQYTSNSILSFPGNQVMFARWNANTYTVTYNGNGATSGSTANSSHTYGIAKNLTANGFARAYTVSYNANGGSVSPTSSTATYSFAGWIYNGTNYSNGQSVSNLTAINGGTVTMTARWNSASVTLPTPTRAGYSFNGWYTAASGGTLVGNAGASYTPTSTLTVYAHWVDNIAPSAVTVSYNGGSNTCTWKNNYNISLSATDAGSGIKHYEIDWDGDGVANGTTASNFIPWNGYSSCNNRFRAVDVAGNVGPWSAVHHIHMDTEAPAKTTVNLNGYTSGASATSTVTITPSASDNVGIAKFQYSHDGANWTDWPPGTGSWAITWNGNWYFYIRAVDHAGNVGTSCDVFHVIVNKPYQVSNGNYASTLAEAISLAAAGNTITLLANVTDSSAATFSKNLTFNSNGHTLTRTAAITINSGVSATFTGTGIIASSSTVINNKGTLKISNGNYVSTGSVNTITTSGTLTINAGNIMEYGGTDTSKSAISIAATAGTTTLNKGKIYSKKGRGVTIDKGAGMLYVGATGGTYEANGRDLIIYGGYVSIYGKNGKSTITLRNGTQYATGSKWVTANIDEKVSRGSCSFNTYANGSAKNYSNPALTIGSYTIAAGNKNCYKLWLSKSTTSTATCPS